MLSAYILYMWRALPFIVESEQQISEKVVMTMLFLLLEFLPAEIVIGSQNYGTSFSHHSPWEAGPLV